MPSDLPCTIVLDVWKFPAAASRVDISSAIVNRFTAYKVNISRDGLLFWIKFHITHENKRLLCSTSAN